MPIASHCCWFGATFVLAVTGIFSDLCSGCEFTLRSLGIPQLRSPPAVELHVRSLGSKQQTWLSSSRALLGLFPVSFMSCFTPDLGIPCNRICFLCHLALPPRCQSMLDFPGCSGSILRGAGGASHRSAEDTNKVLWGSEGLPVVFVEPFRAVSSCVQSCCGGRWFSHSLQD